jgi:predicted Rossmann fold flavoprotein
MSSGGPVVDAAVIGGGAAGLATAIFAAQRLGPGRVVVLDGAARLGAKILVSGGGRCNVTHERVSSRDYFANQPIVRNVLRGFDEQATVRWFESLGVTLKREPTGKLFPVSDDARSVLSALLKRCEALGVELRPGHRVHDLRSGGEGEPWTITHERGELAARVVALATGGRSLPRTGSDGEGWAILQRLGHTVTPTWQALVPLVLESRFFHAAVSGISQDVTLRLWGDGRVTQQRRGSLLWTHFGVSGPVVMDLSRAWVGAAQAGTRPRLTVNLLDEASFEQVEGELVQGARAQPRRPMRHLLTPRLTERLVDAVMQHAGLPGSMAAGQWSREQRRSLVHHLVDLELPVVGPRGWNYAEVTAGGVPLSEMDYRTMESRAHPGLFLVGELLDCDGRIGGFNFQWAWSSGFAAGAGIARRLTSPTASSKTFTNDTKSPSHERF